MKRFIILIDIDTCLVLQAKTCEAKRDGKCRGAVKTYGHQYFNCLMAGEHHNFCSHHYSSATYCPIHPTFNRVL